MMQQVTFQKGKIIKKHWFLLCFHDLGRLQKGMNIIEKTSKNELKMDPKSMKNASKNECEK